MNVSETVTLFSMTYYSVVKILVKILVTMRTFTWSLKLYLLYLKLTFLRKGRNYLNPALW
jgi:hypothetical protein